MFFITVLIFLIIFFIIGYVVTRKGSKKILIPPVISPEGLSVPIMDAREGINELFEQGNKITSKLILFDDRFEYRILNSSSHLYTEVKDVDLKHKNWGIGGLAVTFTNADKNFYVYMNKNNIKEVLSFFQSKGCKLTEKALNYINN